MASISTAASFVIRCVLCFIFIIILVSPQIAARSLAGASNIKGSIGDSKIGAGRSISKPGYSGNRHG
ncbi:hypothetical protein LguiA_033612 [Lonicera macranthoides]